MTTVVEQLQLLIDERLGHLERIVAIDRTLADAHALLERTLPDPRDCPVQESRSTAPLKKTGPPIDELCRKTLGLPPVIEDVGTACRTLGDVVARSLERAEAAAEPEPEDAPDEPEPTPRQRAYTTELRRDDVRDALAKHGPITYFGLATILGHPKGNVYNHLHQLKLRGVVVREVIDGQRDPLWRMASTTAASLSKDVAPEPQSLRAKNLAPVKERRCSRCINKFPDTGAPYCSKCTPIIDQERRSRQAGFARTMPPERATA